MLARWTTPKHWINLLLWNVLQESSSNNIVALLMIQIKHCRYLVESIKDILGKIAKFKLNHKRRYQLNRLYRVKRAVMIKLLINKKIYNNSNSIKKKIVKWLIKVEVLIQMINIKENKCQTPNISLNNYHHHEI